ncbi:hypothetical protein GRZ55_11420 [Chelativorans sp. ZYF759]|uniref:hypothetical protein n=1 Tax=Chelativorans sp. ZYF759 TaxID=2692213 RepID=UPI00145E7064|nr:hypothetical protein [Chelativorans sp. ZYF759]NMG39854.1 hypothetical protein [Chelativorans sp. ZYF759]
MVDPKTTYPGIARAALLIALDNGGINRFRSQQQQEREMARWLATQPEHEIKPVDAWLATLSDEQMEQVCCGGEGEPEQAAAMADAPPFTNEILNSYFEEVC